MLHPLQIARRRHAYPLDCRHCYTAIRNHAALSHFTLLISNYQFSTDSLNQHKNPRQHIQVCSRLQLIFTSEATASHKRRSAPLVVSSLQGGSVSAMPTPLLQSHVYPIDHSLPCLARDLSRNDRTGPRLERARVQYEGVRKAHVNGAELLEPKGETRQHTLPACLRTLSLLYSGYWIRAI